MRRIIFWLTTALVTFAFGVAATAIYRISETTQTIPTVEMKVEVELIPFPEGMPFPDGCYPGRSFETNAMDQSSYFPPNVFSANERHGQFEAEWFSRHLEAMNEDPLHWSDEGEESYRFLWLRTFHAPVAVRIWRCGTERFISVKEMSGRGGYEPGNLIRNEQRTLTDEEWNQFIRLLDNACFWQLSTPNEILGTDGAQWVFEGVKAGRYHVVNRWSPRSGSFRELCLYALQLGLKIDPSSNSFY